MFEEEAALEDVAVAGATSTRAGNGGIRPAVIEGGGPLQSPSVVIPFIKLPLLSEGGKSTPAEPILPDGGRPTRGSCGAEPIASLSCGAPALPCGRFT